jgi:hypothetical protein
MKINRKNEVKWQNSKTRKIKNEVKWQNLNRSKRSKTAKFF